MEAAVPRGSSVTVNDQPPEDAYMAGLRTRPFDEVTVPKDALFVLGRCPRHRCGLS